MGCRTSDEEEGCVIVSNSRYTFRILGGPSSPDDSKDASKPVYHELLGIREVRDEGQGSDFAQILEESMIVSILWAC